VLNSIERGMRRLGGEWPSFVMSKITLDLTAVFIPATFFVITRVCKIGCIDRTCAHP
jgi:hypothetical protein